MAGKKVVLLGLGRIGLPTAACLAQAGYDVLGVDIDEQRLRDIGEGNLDRNEPGLLELVDWAIKSGRLRLSTGPEKGDIFLLCLPTSLARDLTCNLDYLESALESIAGVLEENNLVILESTVPVHTTRDMVVPKLESLGVDVGSILFAYAPERIISGKMLEEIKKDDRIVGGTTPGAAEAAGKLYQSFVKGQIFLTDSSTAELVKLIENTYRDVNIAFANEVALFCEREGLDAWQAIGLANRHPRVNIHQPGPGVGGHCIPVVPYFLAQSTKHSSMIHSARQVNDSMPRYVANIILRAISGTQNPIVALMGVSYKPNSSDPINSPALQVMDHLKRENLEVLLCDPLVSNSNLDLVSIDEAMAADCIVFLLPHDIFRELKPSGPRRGRGSLIDITHAIDLDTWALKGWNVIGFARNT